MTEHEIISGRTHNLTHSILNSAREMKSDGQEYKR